MDTTATLRSPAHAGLVPGDDPKYEMYHSSRYDHRFGTRRIRPRTRGEHARREFLGAPYNFTNNSDNPFESSRPTDHSPSPELEDVWGFLGQGSPSEDRDGESDFSNPFGQWYGRQREEEGRQDALLNRQQRAELLAVSRDPAHNPIPVPPPRNPQRPNDKMQSPNMVSMHPFNRDNPSIDQGYLWFGIWQLPPFPGGLPTPDESDDGLPRQEKKRRGRPRKELKAAVVRDAPRGGFLPSKRKLGKRQVEAEEAPVKRKRGRPRKDGGNGGNGGNGVILQQSSMKARQNGRPVAERTAFDTALRPQEPAALEIGGRSGGGGKYRPGEVPGHTATLPPPSEKMDAEHGEAIASLSREEEKEKEVIGSAVVLSPMEGSVYEPGASSDASVEAVADVGREERRSSGEKFPEAAGPSWNIFDSVILPARATRSGKEFTS